MQNLELEMLDNPSAGNYEESGELNLEEKRYAKAREAFAKAIEAYGARKANASANDTLHSYYGRAKSALGLGDYVGAIPGLERVACADVKFDYYRAAGVCGTAESRSGE